MATKPVWRLEHAYLFSRFYQFYPYYAIATAWSVISATHFNLMLVDKKSPVGSVLHGNYTK